MSETLIVPDASVVNKLFLAEEDSDWASELFKFVTLQDYNLLAPDILQLEMCKTSLHYGIPFKIPIELLQKFVAGGLQLVHPSPGVWETAEKIAKSGSRQSGYPGLEDCIYHALAIHEGGLFVTADRRHMTKTKKFGHMCLLSQWQKVLL